MTHKFKEMEKEVIKVVEERMEEVGNTNEVEKHVNPVSNEYFTAASANDCIYKAMDLPDLHPLWKNLWYEGEVCCFFADTNLGKSIYAVQIGDAVARNRRVLYFDFEMGDRQFKERYTDSKEGFVHIFSDGFIRLTPNVASSSDYDANILRAIEHSMIQNHADTAIIDNLTSLCNGSEAGDVAGRFMQDLMGLKRKYGWSIMIVAHTPKLPFGEPISVNSLAGSKRLITFFDSAFALGRSMADENIRYLKQVKIRSGEMTYGADNVITMTLEKRDGFLGFVETGFATEYSLLRRPKEPSERDREVMELTRQGMSQREIAQKLGVSQPMVHKIQRRLQRENLLEA